MENTQAIINILEAKKAAINAELELLDARKANQLNAQKLLKANAEKKQTRKNDNRQKFIIGAVILKEMQKDLIFKNQILEMLNRTVSSTRDRDVLGLDLNKSA